MSKALWAIKHISHLHSICRGPRAWKAALFTHQVNCKRKVPLSHPHPELHKALIQCLGPDHPSHAASDLLGCLWKIISPSVPPYPDPVTAQCHSEGVVGYYIPERKGCAQARDTRPTWGHSLLATELSVSLQTIGLCVVHLLLPWQFTCFLLQKPQTSQYPGTAAQGIVCPGGKGRKRVRFGPPQQLPSSLVYSHANAMIFTHLNNDFFVLITKYWTSY